MQIGYARVSTSAQDLEDQREQLAASGCERIFAEKVSGARSDRPELKRLLEHIRAGDVVTVTRLDRLARSTRGLLDLVDQLNRSGAGFRSLAEPWADTTSPAGKMVMTVMAGIAEFERSLIIERTQRGQQAARERGVKFGAKPKLDDHQIQGAQAKIAAGESVAAVARQLNVNRSTLYRALTAVEST
ncbi:MAG: recombinase family protein [Wenzhouxiangella sp.]|nr:recombinase family protein [Wenzhouxiangella sp.]MCH8479654.1 recombinase family protein [Wenzhouxiangella sp.]